MKLSTRIVLIILGVYLLGVIAIFSSCTSVKKLRTNVHTETVKTETVQKSDTKDSTSKTVVKKIDSSGTSITIEYDSTTAGTATSFDIITYPTSKDQYTERISIKSSVTPKSITVNQAKKKQAERIDSTVKNSRIVENVKKEEKVVSKVKTVDKKKFKVSVTLMIIIIAAIIALIVAYKYRKQIKLFIIKLPFKFLP